MDQIIQIAIGVTLGYIFIQVLKFLTTKLQEIWYWFRELNVWLAVGLLFMTTFFVIWLISLT